LQSGANVGVTMSEPFEEEMGLIGRIISEWNDVEHTWYIIYSLMMYQTPKDIRDAIYKLCKTGAAQRELTMAVSNEILIGRRN